MPVLAEVPQGITVVAGETSLAIKWPPVPRAEQYRIWARVVGANAELASVAYFTLEPLPRNSLVEVALSALNAGGESARSEIVSVMTF